MYLAPESLQEALALRARHAVAPLAGGTDHFPALGDDGFEADDVLDLAGVGELGGISCDGSGWRIGAAVTWTEILEAALPPAFDGLKLAAREVGSVQIQNVATIAGNFCNASPAADGVPPLLTLDAEVEIASLRGVRRMPLTGFLLGPRRTVLEADELVTAIRIPSLPAGARSGFHKLGARKYLVISIAMAAAVVTPAEDGTVADARLSVGSCSPVAVRLPELEAALSGVPFEAGALAGCVRDAHLGPLSPVDDIRGTGEYRREAVATLLRRLLADLATPGAGTETT